MICAWTFAIFKFGLRYCSFEVNVPQRWSLLRVRLTAGQIAQEGALTGTTTAIFNGGVEIIPVNGKSKSTEEIFKDFFVFVGEFFAQLNEVGS